MALPNPLVTKAAKSILNVVQQMWGQKHVFRRVDARDFRLLDLRFYSRVQKQMEALGFSWAGDIEDESVKAGNPDPRTFLRIMISRDAAVTAAIYHAKPKFPWPLLCGLFGLGPLKIYEFESEFENGHTLTTSICSPKSKSDSQESAVKLFSPRNTAPGPLLERHTAAVKKICADHSTEPVPAGSLDAVCESQNRQIERNRRHLEEIGWVSREYLVRQFGKDDKFINDVHEEVQRLVRKQLITGEA